jgi:hypothetical protein
VEETLRKVQQKYTAIRDASQMHLYSKGGMAV